MEVITGAPTPATPATSQQSKPLSAPSFAERKCIFLISEDPKDRSFDQCTESFKLIDTIIGAMSRGQEDLGGQGGRTERLH